MGSRNESLPIMCDLVPPLNEIFAAAKLMEQLNEWEHPILGASKQ